MLDNTTYFTTPIPEQITHKNITLSYIINPRTNLQIYTGIDYRTKQIDSNSENSSFFMFGIRTSINNFYYDF